MNRDRRKFTNLLFAVAALVFGLLSLGAVLSQLNIAPASWTVGALIAILGTSAALGAAAPIAPPRVLRVLAAAVAIGYALVALTMPFVVQPIATAGAAPWPLGLTALGTTAAALAFRPVVAWASTLALGASVVLDRVTTTTADLAAIAVQDGAYALFFGALFVALTVGAISAARGVDAAAAEADRAASDAAAARAQQEERARVDALVHDRVLATLLLAASRLPGSEAAVQTHATLALAELHAIGRTPDESATVPLRLLTDRLRNEVTLTTPWAEVDEVHTDPTATMPAAVVEALLGAAGEALRNAVQHAGPRAAVAVRLEASPDRTTLIVLDDGPGFDPRLVRPGRLGIASSIVGRMRAAGGDAAVRSKPGVGTVVQLDWPAR